MAKELRILFPYVEAGIGHIMPMKAFVNEFSKKYGDEFEIVEVNFFKDANDKDLLKYEKWYCDSVRNFAKFPIYGHLTTTVAKMTPIKIVNWFMMKATCPKVYKKAIKQMEDYEADIVFSTHWATNYYAMHSKNHPYSIMYCPDCTLNHAFDYDSSLSIISTKIGYEKGLKNKRRYNKRNLKQSSFLIRPEAFEVPFDKYENRKNLNLPLNKFTIMMMEGGYGVGKMKYLCEQLVKENLNITIVAACGKNDELYEYLNSLEVNSNVTFVPLRMTEHILSYIAACDLFVGKGGNSIAEPTFFGHPSIITTLSTGIELDIANFYAKNVGCAIISLYNLKTLKLIRNFINNPALLKEYENNALLDHDRYGCKPCVDLVYHEIKKWKEGR